MKCPKCGCDRVKNIKTNSINGVFSADVMCKNCDTPFSLTIDQYSEMLREASKRLTMKDIEDVCNAIINNNS